MSAEPEKRGPGRPRKEQPFAPAQETAEPDDFDLQAAVLAAVRKNFPDGELSLKLLDESDPKLMDRRLMSQLKVKVILPAFALATLIPADADQPEVDAAMTRMRSDKLSIERHIAKQSPEPMAPAGTRD